MFSSTDEEEKFDEDICTVPLKKSKIDKQLEMWTKYLDENVQKREVESLNFSSNNIQGPKIKMIEKEM